MDKTAPCDPVAAVEASMPEVEVCGVSPRSDVRHEASAVRDTPLGIVVVVPRSLEGLVDRYTKLMDRQGRHVSAQGVRPCRPASAGIGDFFRFECGTDWPTKAQLGARKFAKHGAGKWQRSSVSTTHCPACDVQFSARTRVLERCSLGTCQSSTQRASQVYNEETETTCPFFEEWLPIQSSRVSWRSPRFVRVSSDLFFHVES